MNFRFRKCFAIILLLVAILADTACEAVARGVPFSFDSIWFYREGTRVVPEISRRWLTVVFDPRYLGGGAGPGSTVEGADPGSTVDGDDPGTTGDGDDGFIRTKARAIVKSHNRLTDYLHDPNLADGACFFRMRNGLKPEEIRQLVNQLSRDKTVSYVHPTVVLNNGTFAFFNTFELEWKTGTPGAQREALLRATHAAVDENDEKENRYTVDVARIPFFRALNLLAEDVRVLRVTPRLVEIKPTISPRLSLYMRGGNIGDSIPFSLTVTFTDRVNIDPSSLATLNLRPAELQKELFDCTFDPYDYAKSATKSPIVITGRLRFFAPGEFSVPAIKISYSCPSCPDTGARSIETEPVPFRVSSIIPKVKSENRLIVPTDPVSPEYGTPALQRHSRRYLWLAIASFAGLVPCAVWAFLLRPRVSAERDRREERKQAALLAGKLRVLLFAAPAVPHWSYLGEVGALLREYLVLLYGIDSKYRGGSGRRFMETIETLVPPETLAPLSGIFSAIDNGVALESELYRDMDQLQRDILNVLDLTARNGAAKG